MQKLLHLLRVNDLFLSTGNFETAIQGLAGYTEAKRGSSLIPVCPLHRFADELFFHLLKSGQLGWKQDGAVHTPLSFPVSEFMV